MLSLRQLLWNLVSQNPIFLLATDDFNAINSFWWKKKIKWQGKASRLKHSHVLTGWASLFLILPIFSKILLMHWLGFYELAKFCNWQWLAPSLHLNCYHQILFSKLNLKVEYPSLYQHLELDYKNSDSQLINKAIEMLKKEMLKKLFQLKIFTIN